jgi:uncharacterized damage-inducible protein DinB
MNHENAREAWQSGPVANVPPLLQPVAHALIQARKEVNLLVKNFPEAGLWQKPAGVASVGFHLQHLTGVVDRLFTYAKGDSLNENQFAALQAEGDESRHIHTVDELVQLFNLQVDKALQQLSETDEATLTEVRGVGRAQIPSTVLGLLFHAAEHTMRHVGQLLVTIKVVKAGLHLQF